jgi:hypothetical protein
MKSQRFHGSLLVLPALLAFSGAGQGVRYAPATGLKLTKTLSQHDTITLDNMSVVVNGMEQDPSQMGMEQDINNQLDLTFVDEYQEVAEGRPTRLKRTYAELKNAMDMKMSNAMMGDTEIAMTGKSALEGLGVVFTWNADSYGAEFAEDGQADEELLKDLAADTDLAAFLPTGEVEEGATWEVEANELRSILAFGGNLKFEMESEDMPEMMGMGGQAHPSPDQFLGDIEGTLQAEFRGTREQDEVQVAVIHLKISVTSAKDMTQFFRDAMEDAEMPEGMNMKMEYRSADMEYELEGEAILLWNLAGNYAHSFELNGKANTTMDMAMNMEMEGAGAMEFEMSMDLKSDSTIALSVRAE